MRKILKIDNDNDIQVGSVVRYKQDKSRHVGEVFSFVGQGDNGKVDIIMYDKRLKPIMRTDGTYRIKRIKLSTCKLIDENFKFKYEKTYELGDVVVQKRDANVRYGVITGFTHPDGLFSTSYEHGYNGVDLIDCVEISKRGLSRKRDVEGNIKRFSTFNQRLSTCEVDLWNRSGPKIVHS